MGWCHEPHTVPFCCPSACLCLLLRRGWQSAVDPTAGADPISSNSMDQQQSSDIAENGVKLVTPPEQQLGPPISPTPQFSTDPGRYARSRAKGLWNQQNLAFFFFKVMGDPIGLSGPKQRPVNVCGVNCKMNKWEDPAVQRRGSCPDLGPCSPTRSLLNWVGAGF